MVHFHCEGRREMFTFCHILKERKTFSGIVSKILKSNRKTEMLQIKMLFVIPS